MLWRYSKARKSSLGAALPCPSPRRADRSADMAHGLMRWLPFVALVVAAGFAVQGYRATLAGLAVKPLFLTTARVGPSLDQMATGSVGTNTDPISASTRRRIDRLLDLDDAQAAGADEAVALSRVSESDGAGADRPPAASGRSLPGKSTTARALGSYRTVCVRLCDGAFFPVSHATTRRHFARDSEQCASRCGSPSRLYVYRSGASPDTMRDLDGNPYLALSTAFAFRDGRTPQCACKAEPWDEAATERHRMYALEARALAGDGAAARELELRRAVYDVRSTAPDGELANLGLSTDSDRTGASGNASSRFVFGPPIVAPLDPGANRAPAPMRYAGELQPLTVVLDATGSPVRRQLAQPADRPVVLTMLSRVDDATRQPAVALSVPDVVERDVRLPVAVQPSAQAVSHGERTVPQTAPRSAAQQPRGAKLADLAARNHRLAAARANRPVRDNKSKIQVARAEPRPEPMPEPNSAVVAPEAVTQTAAPSDASGKWANKDVKAKVASKPAIRLAKAGKADARAKVVTKMAGTAPDGFDLPTWATAGGRRRVALVEPEIDWRVAVFRPY